MQQHRLNFTQRNSYEYDHINYLDVVETVDESVPSSESESSGDCFGDLDGSLPDQENDSFNEPIDLSSEELLHVMVTLTSKRSYLTWRLSTDFPMKGLETLLTYCGD